MVLSSAAAAAAASPAPARRALSLYRSLLRAARSLPARQDRESLEEETRRRFRAERAKGKEKKEKGSGGGKNGDGEGGEEIALAALFDEAEARLYDARHHGIPYARLEHAAQIPRAVLESARELLKGGRDDGGGVIKLPKDRSARAKLEAAVERRRLKKQLEEEKNNND